MVTIRDIAKLSGYSVTTVSRALNNHDDVNQETKAAIRTIADREGYAPNVLAQGLVSRDSKTFGFISSNAVGSSPIDNFTFLLFMKSLEQANVLGYDIVMIYYNEEIHKNKSFKQFIAERNLTGAILQGFDADDPLCKQALESSIPTVFIDIGLSNQTSGYVVSDIEKAADIGFKYLLENCGYRNLLFVHGSLESWVTSQWLAAVEKAENKYHSYLDSFNMLNGHYLLSGAQEVLKVNSELLKPKEMAIFCASDLMGIGVLQTLMNLGYKVPEDFSVLGYDGMDISQYVTPSLSTVTQHPGELGAQAINLLIELKNGDKDVDSQSYRDIDVDLIIRDSTRELQKC